MLLHDCWTHAWCTVLLCSHTVDGIDMLALPRWCIVKVVCLACIHADPEAAKLQEMEADLDHVTGKDDADD